MSNRREFTIAVKSFGLGDGENQELLDHVVRVVRDIGFDDDVEITAHGRIDTVPSGQRLLLTYAEASA